LSKDSGPLKDIYSLPKKLKEVSGNSYANDTTLKAQNQHGLTSEEETLFTLKKQTKKQKEHTVNRTVAICMYSKMLKAS
jgi:hypothetical protein